MTPGERDLFVTIHNNVLKELDEQRQVLENRKKM
jgi:hypothetical protein